MRHAIAAAMITLAATAAGAAEQPKPPFWASIAAGQARMRTGPARSYPASWLYRRPELPVRVIGSFKEWRKVEDPDGTQGWIQANLLSASRTAMVKAAQPVPMLDEPTPGAMLKWRAAPGVVGRISRCGGGWCQLDVKGRAGFVETGGLWGIEPGETLP